MDRQSSLTPLALGLCVPVPNNNSVYALSLQTILEAERQPVSSARFPRAAGLRTRECVMLQNWQVAEGVLA